MGLNRILLAADEVVYGGEGGIREAHIPEDDERAKHIRDVLNSTSEKDTVRVAVEGVGVCDATLKSTSSQIALVLNEIEQPAVALPEITLVLAMPRPRAARRAVRNAAQLGVQRILFVGASRVENSFFKAKLTQHHVLVNAAKEGVMQAAVDSTVPTMEMEPRLWKLGDKLGDVNTDAAGTIRVLLHPGETTLPLANVLRDLQAKSVVLAVGPEGGWLHDEIEFLEKKEGFVRATMGDRILTSEVAVTVAITVVHQYLASQDAVNPNRPVLLRTS